jgi:hypothetical protein
MLPLRLQSALIMLWPAAIVASQFWIVRADPMRPRLLRTAGLTTAAIIAMVVLGYALRHPQRNNLPFFSVPAVIAVLAAMSGGAWMLRHVMYDWHPLARFIALYFGNLIVGGALFGLAVVLLLAALWKN